MKMSEILKQEEWNDLIKSDFILGIKRYGTNHSKIQNCRLMALILAKTGEEYKIKEALKLIQFAQNDIKPDSDFSEAELLWVKGYIYEFCYKDYTTAYDIYCKWAALNSNLGGHADARLRTLLQSRNYTYSEDVEKLFWEVHDDDTAPSKSRRFYFYLAKAVIALDRNDLFTAKQSANEAMEVVNEGKSHIEKTFHFPDRFSPPNDALSFFKNVQSNS